MARRRFENAAARRAFWRDLVEAWPASGQIQRDYCRERGVSVHSFQSWSRKLKRSTAGLVGKFVPVRLTPASAPIEVVLTNGRVLRVPTGCDARVVSDLATALEHSAC